MTPIRAASAIRLAAPAAGVFAALAAGLLAALAAPPVAAQAPTTSVGLGYRVAPVDGRAAALGGTGVGLLGGTFSIRNPADLTQHRAPGFGLSFSGESVRLETAGRTLDTGRERFTTIRALVPFSGWAASIAFGGEFDQDWNVRFRDTLVLADGSVPFEEVREHDGGISAIDLSLARSLGPVSLGVSAQRLNGSLRQEFTRRFEAPLDGAPVLGNAAGARAIAYRAWRFKAGASIAVGDRIALSGSFGLPGTLTASPQEGDDPSSEFDLPASFEAGGSARLGDRVLVTAAGGWGGWSDVGEIDGATSHDVTWMGAGIEYGGLSLLGGRFPLRLGARRAELPFSRGEDPLSERAITGGFGWEFQGGLAALDLAFEVGSRGDFETDGLEESFQRVTLGFTLRQTGSP